MIELVAVSARAAAERGRARTILSSVTLEAKRGVLAIIGAHKDGTALLLDVIAGAVRPRSGRVVVLGGSPEDMRHRVARVSLEAPLPDALRVEEVCDLSSDLRSEPRRPASERLAVLGIAGLAQRNVRTLSTDERRTVALAIALSSPKAEVLLVEEPLVNLDPVAPRLVIDALRARAAVACVIVTTASARDATRLADRFGVLTAGVHVPVSADQTWAMSPGTGVDPSIRSEALPSMRILVGPTHGKNGAAALLSALSTEDVVTHVETSTYAARAGNVAVLVSGRDLLLLAKAVTHAVATAGVDVELVEPSTLPLDGIRAAIAARRALPPAGSPVVDPGSIATSSSPPPAVPDPGGSPS